MSWLTFVNMGLLSGAAAATIPLLIYLWHRQRRQIIRWGAMHLLDEVLISRKRSLKIERLLLLLVRCSIPLLLALAMARPVLLGAAPLLGDVRRSVLILLDNSYSMQAGSSDPLLKQAQRQITKILRSLPRGSDAQIILMAGGAHALTDEPTYDLPRLQKAMENTDAGYGSADVPRSLELAGSQLSRMTAGSRDIIILSDFQANSWSDDDRPKREPSTQMISKLGLRPRIALLPLHATTTENIAVESLDYSRTALGVGQRLELRANIRNFGSKPRENLRVYFRADGAQLATSQVSLEPRQSAQVLFEHRFEQSGSHIVEVTTDNDELAADNSLAAAMVVWDKLPVLILNGNLSKQKEIDYLQLALQPDDSPANSSLIQAKSVHPAAADVRDLATAKVVVLSNVPSLSDAWISALQEFVREGNGLLIFPGPSVDTNWYNQNFLAGGAGLLPARLSALQGQVQADATVTSIISRRFEHAALELFNGQRNGQRAGDLSTATLRTWFNLTPITTSGQPDPFILAELETHQPFLVERRWGQGRVILCATAADRSWSDLPLQPTYLPLIQQLVTYLASHVFPPRNVGVGQPLVALVPISNAANGTATWTDPRGNKTTTPVVRTGNRASTEFTATSRPGIYLVQTADARTAQFVVSTSRTESDITPLTDAQMKNLAAELNASVVRDAQEFAELERATRLGRPMWTVVVALLLAMLFLEIFLQQRFAGVKR